MCNCNELKCKPAHTTDARVSYIERRSPERKGRLQREVTSGGSRWDSRIPFQQEPDPDDITIDTQERKAEL